MTHDEAVLALTHGWPDAQWSLRGDYENIEWRSPGEPPSISELKAVLPDAQKSEVRANAKLNRESFMLALKRAGIYGRAKQYANSLADDHDWRIRWENSAMFDRTDPDLVAGAKDMGLTDSDLDNLFGV